MGRDERELKGYTGNDSNTFFFIAGINVVILAVVIMAASGGFTSAANPKGADVDQDISSWFSGWRSQWAAGARPFKDNTELKSLADAEKKKVVSALRSIADKGDTAKSTDKKKEKISPPKEDGEQDVKMTYLEAIDTLQKMAEGETKVFEDLKAASLQDFETALNDAELFKRITAHLRASRAELSDYWPIAFIAACLGIAMFGVFTRFAQAAQDEVTAQAAEDAGPASPSPSRSPSKSPRRN